MAINNMFFDVSPQFGRGTMVITVTGKTKNTGRNPRVQSFRFTGKNITKSISLLVEQNGNPPFITTESNVSIGRDGGFLIIKGKANTRIVNVSVNAPGNLSLDMSDAEFTVNGVPNIINAPIMNDIGGSEEYEFQFKKLILPNTTGFEKSSGVLLSGDGISVSVLVRQTNQAMGSISSDPQSLTLDKTGAVKTIKITSNKPWTVDAATWPNSTDGLVISPMSGSDGDTVVSISSPANTDVAREMDLSFKIGTEASVDVHITQEGVRSFFITSDDEDFAPSDYDNMTVID